LKSHELIHNLARATYIHIPRWLHVHFLEGRQTG